MKTLCMSYNADIQYKGNAQVAWKRKFISNQIFRAGVSQCLTPALTPLEKIMIIKTFIK